MILACRTTTSRALAICAVLPRRFLRDVLASALATGLATVMFSQLAREPALPVAEGKREERLAPMPALAAVEMGRKGTLLLAFAAMPLSLSEEVRWSEPAASPFEVIAAVASREGEAAPSKEPAATPIRSETAPHPVAAAPPLPLRDAPSEAIAAAASARAPAAITEALRPAEPARLAKARALRPARAVAVLPPSRPAALMEARAPEVPAASGVSVLGVPVPARLLPPVPSGRVVLREIAALGDALVERVVR